MKQIRFTQKVEGGVFEMDSDEDVTVEEIEKISLIFAEESIYIFIYYRSLGRNFGGKNDHESNRQ